jgi:hypothetical protein
MRTLLPTTVTVTVSVTGTRHVGIPSHFASSHVICENLENLENHENLTTNYRYGNGVCNGNAPRGEFLLVHVICHVGHVPIIVVTWMLTWLPRGHLTT